MTISENEIEIIQERRLTKSSSRMLSAISESKKLYWRFMETINLVDLKFYVVQYLKGNFGLLAEECLDNKNLPTIREAAAADFKKEPVDYEERLFYIKQKKVEPEMAARNCDEE